MNPPPPAGGSRGGSRGRRGGGLSKRFNPYQNRSLWNSNRQPPTGPRTNTTSVHLTYAASTTSSESSNAVAPPPPQDRPLISFMLDAQPHQVAGWKLYFPQEEYLEGSSLDVKLKAFRSYVDRQESALDLKKIRTNLYCTLPVQSLLDDVGLQRDWPKFQLDLNERPDETLNCAGLALHQKIHNLPDADDDDDASIDDCPATQTTANARTSRVALQRVVVRLEGCGPCVNLFSLKVSSYGRLVTVRGTIIRASAAQLLCTWMAFRCATCSSEQAIRQTDGCLTPPARCRDGCRARSNFTPLLSSAFTRTESLQMVRLQESMQGSQFDSGRVPRSIEAAFTQDLVDSVCPGDDVFVTGVLKVQPQEECQRKGVASMYKMYLAANSVTSNKASVATSKRSDWTQHELEGICAIQREPDPFRLLVHSLCPSIYGHEMVKAGLILGLLGGSSNTGDSATGAAGARRSEAHVLVVGDPGVGKSQMLQACSNVSPRGIFVCGNSSSNAGLTVSVRHDKSTGGALEAGALVLADQGCCCIDEFDKMSANHQALLEVMEQQTVSVAKAGVLCSLPARTSVLAAANPSGGHYNRAKSVAENLKLNPALLSRFDLVFILLDQPNAHLDSLLTAHIQALHAGTRATSATPGAAASSQTQSPHTSPLSPQSLLDRLKMRHAEHLDALPHLLMQKYIGYARKNIHPVLTAEAAAELKRFYLQLRSERHGVDSIPVTTRQLEALIRLTQARARADLSRAATADHALDVLDIVRHSMVDVFSTDVGSLQVTRQMNGSGMSQATLVKRMLRSLQQTAAALNKTVFSMDELRTAGDAVGAGAAQIGAIVDAMNVQGFLLKKGQSVYKLLID